MRKCVNGATTMGSRTTYLSIAIFANRKNVTDIRPYFVYAGGMTSFHPAEVREEERSAPPTRQFRALQHVSHTEAIGILDPFQRHAVIPADGISGAIVHYLTFGEEV
jgi:hypothetical protein